MQYRELGNSGIRVSEIGFGGWGIGGWGEIDDSEARRALDRAFDLGVTFYDTALGYGDGHSEELIGAAFKKRRDRVVIASKLPPKTEIWPVKPHEPLETTFPADWIVACTEKSLRQLGTDYLDVQQFHAWTDSYTYLDEWREAFLRLKEQGKIRAFGVSVNDWDAYGGANLASTGRVDSIQVIYNIFEQRPAEQLLPAALTGHTGIIVRVPFEEGLLTGRLTRARLSLPGWRLAGRLAHPGTIGGGDATRRGAEAVPRARLPHPPSPGAQVHPGAPGRLHCHPGHAPTRARGRQRRCIGRHPAGCGNAGSPERRTLSPTGGCIRGWS